MISPSMRLKWYKQKAVQEHIVKNSENKEIAVNFGGVGFGKRPDVIKHPKDVLEFAKKGATSFHCSEETWDNPLNIQTGMRKKELDELRIGWDLILDLDCPALELSQITGHVLMDAIKYYGINNFSVKFSGNHGFHIGIPFETFPKTIKKNPTKNLFPDGPRKIASFLRERTKQILGDKMLEFYSLSKIAKLSGKDVSELSDKGIFNPYNAVEVDTVLISSRHLFRMPYSFNEKSGLVSIPVLPKEVLYFNKKNAEFNKVNLDLKFMDRKKVVSGEARKLFIQAFDFEEEKKQFIEKKELSKKMYVVNEEFEKITDKIPEELFPPCIKKGLKGLIDGKKRFMFILINFLSSVGWNLEEIKDILSKWNKRNEEPLRETLIQGQLKHKLGIGKEAVLPPNCDNKAYMIDMQVCEPDNFCKKIKNPVNYSVFKYKNIKAEEKKKPKSKKIKEKTEELEKKD